MKTTTTSHLLLVLILGLLQNGKVHAQGVCKGNDDADYKSGVVDKLEIRQVGVDSPPESPPAKVSKAIPFKGEVYVELHPDILEGGIWPVSSKNDGNNITMEFYAGVAFPDGDENKPECKEGTKIDIDEDNNPGEVLYRLSTHTYNRWNDPNDNTDNCFPRTTNGEVIKASFGFANPMYTGDQSIWTASSDDVDGKDGEYNVCVRVATYRDMRDAEGTVASGLVSYSDTVIKAAVDLTANFATFEDQQVDIYKEAAAELETDAFAELDLKTFLCGMEAGEDSRPSDTKYGLGMDFKVCVDTGDDEQYRLTGFRNVICKNNFQERIMIDNTGAADPLTSVEINQADYWGDLDTDITSDRSIAFKSVVTSGFFADNENTGDFECSGDVDFEAITDSDSVERRGRRRVEFQADNLRQPNQQQQQSESLSELEEDIGPAPFATLITLSKFANADSGGASFSSWSIYGLTTTMTFIVGIIAISFEF